MVQLVGRRFRDDRRSSRLSFRLFSVLRKKNSDEGSFFGAVFSKFVFF